jgi:hypothetical protein
MYRLSTYHTRTHVACTAYGWHRAVLICEAQNQSSRSSGALKPDRGDADG